MTRTTRILRARIIVSSRMSKSMRRRINCHHRYTCRRKRQGMKYKWRSIRTTRLERGRKLGMKKWSTCSLMRLKRLPRKRSRKKSWRIGMCKNRTLRRLRSLKVRIKPSRCHMPHLSTTMIMTTTSLLPSSSLRRIVKWLEVLRFKANIFPCRIILLRNSQILSVTT